jgi:hypothetical protein
MFKFLLINLLVLNLRAETLNDSISFLKIQSTKFGKLDVSKVIASHTSKKFYSSQFKISDSIVQLEAVVPITKDKFLEIQSNLISVMLNANNDRPTPYLGQVTNKATCTTENGKLDTVLIKNGNVNVIKNFADKNFNFNVCDKENVAYQACTSFHHVNSKSIYLKLSVFSSPKKADCGQIVKEFYESIE